MMLIICCGLFLIGISLLKLGLIVKYNLPKIYYEAIDSGI